MRAAGKIDSDGGRHRACPFCGFARRGAAAILAALLFLFAVPSPRENSAFAAERPYFLEVDFVGDFYRGEEKLEEDERAAVLAETAEYVRSFEEKIGPAFDGEITELNAAEAGVTVPLSADVLDLVRRSEELSELLGGAFLPAAGGLVRLWGFAPGDDASKKRKAPSSSAIEEEMALLRGAGLTFSDGGAARSTRAVYDYGGSAKGWLCDEIARRLRDRGIDSGVVSLMSGYAVLGEKKVGNGSGKWSVGVRDPRNPAAECLTFSVGSGSVHTSGDYERYYVSDGKRYCHIIDPNTGAPASRGVMSATVVSESGIFADALATAAFSLGARRTLEIAEEAGASAVIICTDYRYYATDGFEVVPSEEVYPSLSPCPYERGERDDAPDDAAMCAAERALYRKKTHAAEWAASAVLVAAVVALVAVLARKKR